MSGFHRACCCGDNGGGEPPYDPCPDWVCDVLSCNSVACPSAVSIDASGLTLSIDAAFNLGNQPPSTNNVTVGGMVLDQDDFSWFGNVSSIVATCSGATYSRILSSNSFPSTPNVEDYPICGSEAPDQNQIWRRDPSSMGSPDIGGSAGANNLGVMTPVTLYFNDPNFSDPVIDGYFSSTLFKEVTQATLSYSLDSDASGCEYIQQTVSILVTYWGLGKMTGVSSGYFPAPTDRVTAMCLAFEIPITYTMTRPIYCNQGSPICVPSSGEYGVGQSGPGVPTGVSGSTTFSISSFDFLQVLGNGPTLQADFDDVAGAVVAGGTVIVT